jgi:hypothetical protein
MWKFTDFCYRDQYLYVESVCDYACLPAGRVSNGGYTKYFQQKRRHLAQNIRALVFL